jgi:pimeloyl-ACP methyl ester carboxylesterase
MTPGNFKDAPFHSFAKWIGRMVLIGFLFLVVCVVAFIGILFAYSPGTPEPFLDSHGNVLPGSISEKVRLTVNGTDQGMFIKGKDSTNPVLLYLHGGMPDYFLTREYPTGLEDYCTVAWWEQRGSGLSFSSDIPRETMTLEQMISDALEVTQYLRQRFKKDKIYLMGHSGGTFIGIQVIARDPRLFHAYIGVAQMSHQLRSEILAYEYMVKRFRANGDHDMVQTLEAAPVTMTNGTPDAYLAVRDRAMHSLGVGTTHTMNSVVTGILFPSLTCRDYSLREKANLWLGKSRSGVSILWHEMLATDLSERVTSFDVPVYFFHGAYDYTVSAELGKGYFMKIQAPIKGFYIFQHSAHSPLFEEPDKMRQIFKDDIFMNKNDHADFR